LIFIHYNNDFTTSPLGQIRKSMHMLLCLNRRQAALVACVAEASCANPEYNTRTAGSIDVNRTVLYA
jgi:hypothetical protein